MTGRQLCRVKLSHPITDGVAERHPPLLFCVGRHSDTPTVFGRHLDMLAAFGRHLDIRGPCSVRISPENAWPGPNPAREWQNVPRASESRPKTQAMSQSGPGTAGAPGSSESRPNARGDLNRPATLTARDVRRSRRTATVRLLVYIRFVSSPGQRRIFLSACRGRLIPVKGTMGAGVFGRKVRL